MAHSLVASLVDLRARESPSGRSGRTVAWVRAPDLLGALDSTVVLLGYCLMMMAALTRLATVDGRWRITMGRSIDIEPNVAVDSLVSAVVLAASALMGLWAYRLPDGER